MREIAPFGLRMPAELKSRIDREAKGNGRSMNAEIIARLWASIEPSAAIGTTQPMNVVMDPARPSYIASDLTEIERQLIAVFRRMPVERQLALVSLIK